MKKKGSILLLGAVGAIAVTLGWCFYRNSRITAGYERVRVGASDEQVLRLLGAPSWAEACGKSFGTPKPNCTELHLSGFIRTATPRVLLRQLGPEGSGGSQG